VIDLSFFFADDSTVLRPHVSIVLHLPLASRPTFAVVLAGVVPFVSSHKIQFRLPLSSPAFLTTQAPAATHEAMIQSSGFLHSYDYPTNKRECCKWSPHGSSPLTVTREARFSATNHIVRPCWRPLPACSRGCIAQLSIAKLHSSEDRWRGYKLRHGQHLGGGWAFPWQSHVGNGQERVR
jgi:hypothetical protein